MGNLAGTVDLDSIGVPHTWDAWGKNTSTTWDGMDAVGWKGLLPETGTGLIYMRARWYDPELGRFISEDPAGLAGGINPYVFAGDDPINSSDPSGMLVGDPNPDLQLCQSRGGIYVELSNGTAACQAYQLPTINITAPAGPLFGGDEPADPPPSGASFTGHPGGLSTADALTVVRSAGVELKPFQQFVNCYTSSLALGATTAVDLDGMSEVTHAVGASVRGVGAEFMVNVSSTLRLSASASRYSEVALSSFGVARADATNVVKAIPASISANVITDGIGWSALIDVVPGRATYSAYALAKEECR